MLATAGHHAAAATAYAETVRLAPGFLPAYINGGLALESLGLRHQAIEQWQQVADRLAIVDGDAIILAATALQHIARICLRAGDIASAEAASRRTLELEPQRRDAIASWIVLRQIQCKWPVIAPWGKLTRSALLGAMAPMSLAILIDDPMLQLANAWRHFDIDVIKPPGLHTAGRWPAPEAVPRLKRRLRIGYVSADLREHAIGYLTAELFELHDRNRVEVFAYYAGPSGPDRITTRINQAAEHWIELAGRTARDQARQIVHDEIDILVDIDGHTEDSQAALFALRPAPVIVNWLGYPGSMATPHHQYIIADNEIIPPEHEKYYSERVLRLPCYQPTDRRRLVAATLPSRHDAGLPDDAIVYCCFNAAHKITLPTFRCWMAILVRVPNAVLWLLASDPATDERLRQQAVVLGVASDRLVFAERMPNAEHLARYALADLFLDTAPYGAHTTASDALWMAVPVLTIAGRSFASRVCASLVRAAGVAELVCGSRGEYVDLAVELATHPGRLRELRGRLAAGRDTCSLFDMQLLVNRLEELYDQMRNEYLAGEIPVPDLRNLAIYADIGGGFDFEPADGFDLQAYERHYVTALAYCDSVSPIPADGRLWTESR
jgi:predicted O-linked N-acetylglucosamine transferase (SPINDLY family)